MTDLGGKVAIVTGAGRNVGRGIAHALAKAGARVAVFEIDPETGARTAAEIDGLHVVCDVTDPAACEAGVARVVVEPVKQPFAGGCGKGRRDPG